jgi:hypothetical protein
MIRLLEFGPILHWLAKQQPQWAGLLWALQLFVNAIYPLHTRLQREDR